MYLHILMQLQKKKKNHAQAHRQMAQNLSNQRIIQHKNMTFHNDLTLALTLQEHHAALTQTTLLALFKKSL